MRLPKYATEVPAEKLNHAIQFAAARAAEAREDARSLVFKHNRVAAHRRAKRWAIKEAALRLALANVDKY